MRAIVNSSTRIVEDRFASDIAERQRRQADAMKSRRGVTSDAASPACNDAPETVIRLLAVTLGRV
jgi:hypothetical protein